MARYQIRNNMSSRLGLETRGGAVALRPGQTEVLDMYSMNSRRMRGLQQSGSITVVPATNPGGRLSPKLPPVHPGLVRRRSDMPAMPGSAPAEPSAA